jgi:hypothetical protein
MASSTSTKVLTWKGMCETEIGHLPQAMSHDQPGRDTYGDGAKRCSRDLPHVIGMLQSSRSLGIYHPYHGKCTMELIPLDHK